MADQRGEESANLIGFPLAYGGPQRLGSGAEGGTWVATDLGTGRPVVLKRVEPGRVHIVRRAFDLLREVASPHLPGARALTRGGTDDGSRWLVTDFVDGKPLALGAAVSEVMALREALAVAHALAAIHRAGTHHGDVAPGNVIVTQTGGVILVDLGQLGQLGTGTPGFLAPEVLGGGGGPAADRFALGSLLCLRLYGEVPWRRPDAVLAVRGEREVRARVVALSQSAAFGPPSSALMGLFVDLLDPDPRQRVCVPDEIVARLGGLVRAAEAGVDLPEHARWWLPQRWPYRAGPDGPDVAAIATRLAGKGRPRLVVVAGPPGVGRRRVVQELVQLLQAGRDGPRAVACDPRAAGAIVGHPTATWIEAWLQLGRVSSTTPDIVPGRPDVVGLVTEPPWPSLGTGDSPDAVAQTARAHAAMLVDAAASASSTLILPVGETLARALEAAAGPAGLTAQLVVLRVRPWDLRTLSRGLADVLRSDAVPAWTSVLLAATGGWPGRVVAAVIACAELGVQTPSPAAVQHALQSVPGGARLGLDAAAARDVLRAFWVADEPSLSRLAAHLHDGVSPQAAAVSEARRQLGTQLPTLAREVLAERVAAAHLPSLSLAADADEPQAVQAALLGDHALPVWRAGAGVVLRWLHDGGAARIEDEAVAVACRGLLADGDARGALALATTHPDGGACQLEAGRAAQRLGSPKDALVHLDRARTSQDDDRCAAAQGLRWRILVDRGQGSEALEHARAHMLELPTVGLGAATARLWGAMAALVADDLPTALRWLDEADHAGRIPVHDEDPGDTARGESPGSKQAAQAGIAARSAQLRGNLAQAEGDLDAAQRCYAAAAAAFARSGEPVGGLLIRGSLAGLAISTFDTTAGIEDGRWALRGLVSRGQLSATLEAALNLVQLLTRVAAEDSARGIGVLVSALFASHRQTDALVRGRLSRIDAELARRVAPQTAEDAFIAAAVDLEAAAAARDAVEAWTCAAAMARRRGNLARGAKHLDRARAIAADGEDSRAALALEGLELMLARVGPRNVDDAHRVAFDRALLAVHAVGDPMALAARGRLDLAWAVSRGVALAVHRRLTAQHPAAHQAAAQLVATLELIMQKTDPADRPAVLATLTSDVGDRSALRELLSELNQPAAGAADPVPLDEPQAEPPPQTSPPSRNDSRERSSGLVRVFRRFAREDRLEQLLEQVVDALMELTNAERGAVVVLPQSVSGGESSPSVTRLEVTRELAEGGEGVRFSRSVIDRVLAEGEPVLSVDAAHDDRFDGSRSISHLNLRSVLAVPLRFRGELFGAAYVDHRLRRGAFDEDDLARMEEFADLAALAVAHARALAGLRAQAEELERQRQRLSELLEAREVEVEGLRGQVRLGPTDAGEVRHGMVGTSASMQKVFRLIDRLADSDVPVVIHGESGTGKELVARATHEAGPRRSGPFIAENCGAIPETLLETVLFGHARGAFTGAVKSKAGLFEAAHGGTIFLDEVGEMSSAMQTKLLRVLQEGEVRRVGETHSRPVDVRVIAASNRDLDAMVKAGTFRRDLYYRIHVVKLVLPPLREREGDLPALVRHLAARRGVSELTVSPPAMRVLCRHTWPGNIRELDNEIQRWIALSDGTVEVEDLSPQLQAPGMSGPDIGELQIRPRVETLERELIRQALARTSGNQTKAATLLGLSRFGLQKKLRRMAEADAASDDAENAQS